MITDNLVLQYTLVNYQISLHTMATSTLSIYTIVKISPHPDVPSIVGQPAYHDISQGVITFVAPTNPPVLLVVPIGATQYEIFQIV